MHRYYNRLRYIKNTKPCLLEAIFYHMKFNLSKINDTSRFNQNMIFINDDQAYYKERATLLLTKYLLVLNVVRKPEVFKELKNVKL